METNILYNLSFCWNPFSTVSGSNLLAYHLPLQQEIWLVSNGRSNLIGVTHIHLSLIHWSVRPRKWSRPANDTSTTNDLQIGPQMIPRPEWSPDCTANDPRDGNGIFAENEGNEWTQEFGQWIYFIHFFLKSPTANLNGTGSIGSTNKM